MSETGEIRSVVEQLRHEVAKNAALEAENKKLKEREKTLIALEAAGVDNWQGYDDAMEILEQME